MFTRLSGLGVAAAAVAVLAAGAAAADSTAVRMRADGRAEVTVPIGDLDQKSDAGTRAIYRRLTTAARRVCPAPSGVIVDRRRELACQEQALADAVKRANLPRLSALHAERTGASRRLASAGPAARGELAR
jgi:UrcA family protein